MATVHEACYTACCVSVPLVSRGPRCCIYRWTGRLCSDYSNVGMVCRQKGSLRNVANSHFWIFSLFQPCFFLRFYLITHWRYPLLAMQGLCNDRSSVRPYVCLSVCLSVCPVDSSRLLINICRRRQSAAVSGQHQCYDPKRIDADLLKYQCLLFTAWVNSVIFFTNISNITE